jgi:hypothetical protein
MPRYECKHYARKTERQNMKKFLTVSTCAEIFEAPISTITRWCKKGNIAMEYSDGKNCSYVPILDLINWLHSTDRLPRPKKQKSDNIQTD